MKYSMRSAVYDEMIHSLKRSPNSLQDLLWEASQDEKVASIAPFYGFYLYPQEWLHYSLQNKDPLMAEMNEAMLIALDFPTMEAGPKMLLYFSIAASLNTEEIYKQSLSAAFKTTKLFQTYIHLQNRVSLFEKDKQFTKPNYNFLLKEAVASY
jgi:hypothetical protein